MECTNYNSKINSSMFTEEGLKKEVINEASSDPAKLVELFKEATSEEWFKKANGSIHKIFKRIEDLDSEGKLMICRSKALLK